MTNHPNRSKGKLTKSQKEAIERAIKMLGIAADYLDENCDTSETVEYDNAECDGSCVADDCNIARDQLRYVLG